jgi:hypothetical protein
MREQEPKKIEGEKISAPGVYCAHAPCAPGYLPAPLWGFQKIAREELALPAGQSLFLFFFAPLRLCEKSSSSSLTL